MPKHFPENVQELISSSQNEKRMEERLWDLTLLFLEGRQWLNFDDRLGKYAPVVPPRGDGLFRVTVNLLLNVYRNVLARLALAYPSTVVVPASPVYDDIIKAQTSEMALKYFWQSERVKVTMTKMLEWLLTTGTAALHTYYDPGKKSVRLETFGSYNIFFEEGVIEPEKSQWIALRSFFPRDELLEAYPKFENEIGYEVAARPYEDSIKPTLDSAEHPPDRIETYEIYWRDGRHAVVMGNTYLYKEDFPVDAFPVQIVRYSVIPRKLWGLSLLAPLLDLQTLYNKARTQIVHNIEMMSNPKWLVPKTAGVATSAITNKIGEKVYYNPSGGRPEQVSAAPIPSYVIDNVTRVQSEIGDVAGLHSVTLGKRAVGVTSGKAMETLASYDTSQLQGTQSEIESAVAKMAQCALMIMQKYYTEQKMMRMLDEVGKVTFHAIKGLDLEGAPEVFIEAGSLFRDEAQDRDAKVLELLQLGLLPPDQAMDELSFRTGNSFVSKRVQGLAHARDMLEAAKRGGEIELFRSDDLSAFAEVFHEYIQSSEFYTLEEEDQDYIRDVLVAVNAANMPDEQYVQMLQGQQIFPREVAPLQGPAAMMDMSGAMGGPQLQQVEEMAAKQQPTGSIGAAERAMTNRSEALLANRGGM